MALDLKETLWISFKNNAWIYVAPMPEHLTVLSTGQKPTDVEVRSSSVLIFVCACTGYGNTIVISWITTHSVNSTGEDIIPQLDLTHDWCEKAVDTLTLEEQQIESPIKMSTVLYFVCVVRRVCKIAKKRLIALSSPSACVEQLGCHSMGFDEIWYLTFLKNLWRKLNFC